MKKPFSLKLKIALVAFAILALVAILFGYQRWSSRQSTQIVYNQVVVQKGDLQVSILSTGIVQPENRLEIKSPIAGRIEKLLVDEGDVVKKGQTLAWMSSVERAAVLDAASAKGAKELKEWKKLFLATPIIAPINGMIIKRNVEAGQTFTTTDAILVISDRLTVKAQVDETDLAQVRLKQKATIVLDAYPDLSIPSHVDTIAYEATTINNVTTYIVDVIPVKTPSFMRSGMTANVTFEVATKTNILLVPANAVKVHDGTFFVLVPGENADKPPIENEIQTGLSNGKQLEVISGLSEGAIILVPEFKIQDRAPTGANPLSPFRHPQKKN